MALLQEVLRPERGGQGTPLRRTFAVFIAIAVGTVLRNMFYAKVISPAVYEFIKVLPEQLRRVHDLRPRSTSSSHGPSPSSTGSTSSTAERSEIQMIF